MRKKQIKKIITIIVIFILISSIGFVIYAGTQDKTDIVCNDINFFNALKNSLPKNLFISADSSTKTISIPTDTLATITSLSLENSNINDITGLEKFTNLKELNLSNNTITSIVALNDINNLEVLDLSKNTSLGNNVNILANKTNLKSLKIANTGISSISFMNRLTQLKEIDLSENNIGDLQPICNISSIEVLNLSNNRNLTSLEYIKPHMNLTSLNISYTGIANLDGINVLNKLEELNVRSINIEDLSPIVELWYEEETGEPHAYLTNLRKLDVSYTQGIFFNDLKCFTKLNELYMLGCNVYSIDGLIELSNLKYINLEENNIEYLDSLVEWETDEYNHRYVKRRANVKEYVLKNNNISDISVFAYLGDIDYLDLSENHIYDITPLSNKTCTKGFSIKDQDITLGVYDKEAEVNQYIILPSIFQQTKNASSNVATNYDWSLTGMALNTEYGYFEVGKYNVIIDKDKTQEDELLIRINGGAADGTILKYEIVKDGNSIDSLFFRDEKLCEAIYSYLINNKEEYSILNRAKNILNITQFEISRVYELDISSHEIAYLDGLDSFEELKKLNASDNNFSTIEPLKYCINMQELNVSNTSLGNNNSAILKMRMLQKLDFSNTNMARYNIINEYIDLFEESETINLKELNISSNGIEDISGIGKITTLENLYIANNRIDNLSEFTNLTNLKILNAANNNINNIASLSKINTLRTLNISNNRITDISSVNSRITALYFSGNYVSDISSLSKMTSLTDLEMNNNYIDDISGIENLYIKNNFFIQQQKIIKSFDSNSTGTISVELPPMFLAARQRASKVYTEEDFEVNNCTISGNNVFVNVDELENNCATVKIPGGKAKGSILYIAEPIKTEIKYNITEKTNQDVTATITFSRNVIITNNNGSNQYVFNKNGEFLFEFEDENGFIGKSLAKVDWIDKQRPKVSLELIENGNSMRAIITSNEEIQEVDGWVLSKDKKSLTKEYVENYAEDVIVKDLAGNEVTVSVNINIIDNIAPILNIEYSTTEPTDQIVKATITSNEKVQDVEGWTLSEDKKILTKEYTENTSESIVVRDIAGNETIIIVDINNIMKIDSEKIVGDINGNDKIDIGDILVLKRFIAYENSVETAIKHPNWMLNDEKKEIGDINNNGKIDIGDILKLQRYIAASNSNEVAQQHPNWLNIK